MKFQCRKYLNMYSLNLHKWNICVFRTQKVVAMRFYWDMFYCFLFYWINILVNCQNIMHKGRFWEETSIPTVRHCLCVKQAIREPRYPTPRPKIGSKKAANHNFQSASNISGYALFSLLILVLFTIACRITLVIMKKRGSKEQDNKSMTSPSDGNCSNDGENCGIFVSETNSSSDH
jgi:hypothetical protein